MKFFYMDLNKKTKLLVVACHPDDDVFGCGGTLIKHKKLGFRTGIIDLTRDRIRRVMPTSTCNQLAPTERVNDGGLSEL